jgi:preprotein translocase subunit Sss1
MIDEYSDVLVVALHGVAILVAVGVALWLLQGAG